MASAYPHEDRPLFIIITGFVSRMHDRPREVGSADRDRKRTLTLFGLLFRRAPGTMLFMRKRVAAVLSILAALVGGAVVGLNSSGADPAAAPSPNPDRASLFVQPEGTDAHACGDYIATWLDILHAEDAFPINELKADLGQGPLWNAVTDAWSAGLDLETRMPREEAARLVVPMIASACEDPDVRSQFLQLQSS